MTQEYEIFKGRSSTTFEGIYYQQQVQDVVHHKIVGLNMKFIAQLVVNT